eukprot:TRINITY_DN978_c6_g1_i1.p2 TRINITY_DN978_c6_g1~~TRINITY_DN978_c6_g1_i1.p2  ORF type:complete len:186 (+),score=50.58 TRINITY_DN978_c6_g1_i1:47-604(+)
MKTAILLLLLAGVCVGDQKYTYLVDVVVEHAEKTCRMIARDMQAKKKFKPIARCAFLVDQIEEFVSEAGTDVMNKVDQSMADVVDAALYGSNMNEMRRNLRKVSEWILKQKKTPTERAAQEKLRSTMNQWLLSVVTLQKKTDASALQPETIRKLREQGINIPMPAEEDEYDEDDYEDPSWGSHTE